MKEEENIDQLFKDKLGARNFELKASYIANLESKLDSRAKNSNRRNILLLLLIIPIAVYFSYSAFDKNDYLKIVEEKEALIAENLNDKRARTKQYFLLNSYHNDAVSVQKLVDFSLKRVVAEEVTKNGSKKIVTDGKFNLSLDKYLHENLEVSSLIGPKKEDPNFFLVMKNVEDTMSNYKGQLGGVSSAGFDDVRFTPMSKVSAVEAKNLMTYKLNYELINDSFPRAMSTLLALEEEELMDERNWSIGVLFSPDHIFKTPSLELPNNYNSFSKTGFTASLRVRYEVNKNLGIETGVSFSNKGERLVAEKIDTTISTQLPSPISGFTGVPVLSFSQRKIEVKRSYNYIGIPLKANYYFLNNNSRVRLFLSGGILTNFLVNQIINTTIEYDDGEIEKTTQNGSKKDLPKINFTVGIGLGMEYQLSKKVNFRIEPVYRRSLTPITNEPSNKEYFNSLGSNIGLYYRW